MTTLIKISILTVCLAVFWPMTVAQEIPQNPTANNPNSGSSTIDYSKFKPSGTLPVLYINTENGDSIKSKEVYLSGTYWLDALGNDTISPIGSAGNPLALQIRGRGNASWNHFQKPYRLKLDKKASFYNLPKSKHWVLLHHSQGYAEWAASEAGFELARLIGLGWASNMKPVELVLNNVYDGLYFLTENIKIDPNRLDIYEQPDMFEQPDTIPYGWLVEIDNYYDEYQTVLPENDKWDIRYTHKAPEILSEAQQEWFNKEMTKVHELLYNAPTDNPEWMEHVDAVSLARYFIVRELIDDPDGFNGSCYIHRDMKEDAKWTMGPVWDLSCQLREKTDFTIFMPADYSFIPHWITGALRFPHFQEIVINEWNGFYNSNKLEQLYNHVNTFGLALQDAMDASNTRWSQHKLEADNLCEVVNRYIGKNAKWFDANAKRLMDAYAGVNNITDDPSAQISIKVSDGSISLGNLKGRCTVGVYNASGIEVYNTVTNDATLMIDAALSPGIYLLTVKGDQTVSTAKVVIR